MSDRRATFEVVVDGTDGAGKTTCTGSLVARLEGRGLVVATHAPYREREVYPLWERDPARAAALIAQGMHRFRARALAADVIVWDRGWPTAFVSTDDADARAWFEPRPPLTLLLLSTTARAREKARVDPTAGVWDTDEVLVQRFNAAYHALPSESTEEREVLRFHPDPVRMWFDLDAIGLAIGLALERALDARPRET